MYAKNFHIIFYKFLCIHKKLQHKKPQHDCFTIFVIYIFFILINFSQVDDQWFTPTEFEQFSGRGACKDWKRSIRYAGQTLHRLIDDGIIAPHAVSCTCGICCGEEMVSFF